MSMFILTSCSSDDEDDTNQYSFGSLTVANFPLGLYGALNDDGKINTYTGVSFGIQSSNGELYGDVYVINKGNYNFNDVSINKNIITLENNMYVLKYRFEEGSDRYVLTFIWGEVKPEYEYKYSLHFTQEQDKYYKLK